MKLLQPPPQYILPPEADMPSAREFGKMTAQDFSIPSLVGEILYHRGFTTLQEVQDFLYPQLSMLPSPATMKGMGQAVACIIAACRARKPIFIHGDYDVDGITATTLLTGFFGELGITAFSYIPNRLEEKYGLSIDSINRLVAQSDQVRGGVLISVDCGITAVHEVLHAKTLGLRVIITDHHEPQDILPEAEAILNPKQHDCEFPFPLLSGVGVAFFLIMALRRAFVESGVLTHRTLPNLKKYLDLVALGTVADIVPLVGINRILVRAGLDILSAKYRFGVLSLCESCGINDRHILSEDIAFKLAPRINAAGRLGCPRVGMTLLAADDLTQARQAARDLEQLNIQRKALEMSSLSLIENTCAEQVCAGLSGLTVYQQNCHPGILGILASKITDRHCRPVIIFTDDNTKSSHPHLKGSGRSVAGINLFQILEQCSPWIEQFGGHAMAVGLTIKKENLYNFMMLFQQQTAFHEALLAKSNRIRIDCHFQDTKNLTREFAQALQMMQPFGEGNPDPTFLLSGAQLLHPKDNKGHLTFQLRVNEHIFPGIGFHLGDNCRNFRGPVDLVFRLKRSWFKGVGRDQIQALHLVPL